MLDLGARVQEVQISRQDLDSLRYIADSAWSLLNRAYSTLRPLEASYAIDAYESLGRQIGTAVGHAQYMGEPRGKNQLFEFIVLQQMIGKATAECLAESLDTEKRTSRGNLTTINEDIKVKVISAITDDKKSYSEVFTEIQPAISNRELATLMTIIYTLHTISNNRR